MMKKFLKFVLPAAVLTFVLSVFFIGCYDNNDEIDVLKKELEVKITTTQLQAEIDALKIALESAKAEALAAKNDAATAKAAADKAAEDAKTAGDDAKTAGDDAAAAKAAADAAKAAADAAKAAGEAAAAQAKLDAIAEAEAKIAAAKTELETMIAAIDTGISQEALDKVAATVTALKAEIFTIIGHRLTSVVRIPTQTLNDEPAILFTNITYIPQVFDATHTAYTEPSLIDGVGNGEVTKDRANVKRFYLDNQETTAKYTVSPKLGIRKADIDDPFLFCDVQTNYTDSRAVDENLPNLGKDMPVKVAGWDLNEATGVLSVKVAKNVPTDININYESEQTGIPTQKYYIASLQVPIAEANRTDAEKSAGIVPVVASGYSRIGEIAIVPMIKQVGANAHNAHTGVYNRKELLNGRNFDGKYVHYHDSASLYKSAMTELIDIKAQWDQPLDLKKYVTVCEFERLRITGNIESFEVGSHNDIDWASYGLAFRFHIARAAYNKGSTNQQEFATIDTPENGILTSKAYTVDGITQTAVGHEPIVRVVLIDTKNGNNIVAQRYIKLQFANNPEGIILPESLLPEHELSENLVSCKNMYQSVGTQAMNVELYRALENYGLSKDQFHSIYKKVEIESLTKDGVEILTSPLTWTTLDDTSYGGAGITVAFADAYAKDAADNSIAQDVIFAMAKDQDDPTMSYNLKWYMTSRAVGKIALTDVNEGNSTYIIKVRFQDPSGINGDVIKTFKQVIHIPTQEFKFQGTYWDKDAPGKIYNVNSHVYDAVRDYQTFNPKYAYGAWTGWNTGKAAYNHIGAELMKGFIDIRTDTYSPTNLAQFITLIRSCAEVRFEFDDTKFSHHPHLAGYNVTNDRQTLWSNTQPPLTDIELRSYSHPGTRNDARNDRLAAVIHNQFGATASENRINLPFNQYDETLGSGVNEAVAQLWLSEINESEGSTAACNLIGKKVPMQLVVEYNEYNKVPVHGFELFIIDPLNVFSVITDDFIDAQANGSYVNVQTGLYCTDWNNYIASRANLPAPSPNPNNLKDGFNQQYWDFYQIRNVIFNTETSKTNLKMVEGVLIPTEGVTNGPLPTTIDIKQVESYNQATGAYVEVSENANYLRYFNDQGTPVNMDYTIFMDAQIRYKWGVKTSKIDIGVKKSID